MATIFDLTGIPPTWFLTLILSAALSIGIFVILIKNLKNAKTKKQQKINAKKILSYRFFIVVIIAILAAILSILGDYSGNQKENLYLSKSDYIFGIDISHYQGKIEWDVLRTSKHAVEYIFIRATMGADSKDRTFEENWIKSKQRGFLRGAYHFYRPHENSTLQFNNFKNVVKLELGDFPPVLDIEQMSKYGSDNLRKGVLNWLQLAHKHYGIKPIVYTGRDFYTQHLQGHVDDYPLWIASYSNNNRVDMVNWTFHQFTEKIIIKGTQEYVDGNYFKGELQHLKELCIKPH